jgi:hypothetical protein
LKSIALLTIILTVVSTAVAQSSQQQIQANAKELVQRNNSPAQAQRSAQTNLRDTLNWLENSSQAYGFVGSVSDPEKFPFGLERFAITKGSSSCEVIVNDTILRRWDDGKVHESDSTTIVNLTKLDPTTMQVYQTVGGWWMIKVHTTNDEHVIIFNGKTSDDSRQQFSVEDEHYAYRFAKAFKHAVILCGGKPSTF